MFDFSKIGETLTELIGGRDLGGVLQPGGLLETLQNIGLDPAQLQNASMPEVLQLLQDRGIDVTQLPVAELEALLQNIGVGQNAGVGENLADLAASLTGRQSGPGSGNAG